VKLVGEAGRGHGLPTPAREEERAPVASPPEAGVLTVAFAELVARVLPALTEATAPAPGAAPGGPALPAARDPSAEPMSTSRGDDEEVAGTVASPLAEARPAAEPPGRAEAPGPRPTAMAPKAPEAADGEPPRRLPAGRRSGLHPPLEDAAPTTPRPSPLVPRPAAVRPSPEASPRPGRHGAAPAEGSEGTAQPTPTVRPSPETSPRPGRHGAAPAEGSEGTTQPTPAVRPPPEASPWPGRHGAAPAEGSEGTAPPAPARTSRVDLPAVGVRDDREPSRLSTAAARLVEAIASSTGATGETSETAPAVVPPPAAPDPSTPAPAGVTPTAGPERSSAATPSTTRLPLADLGPGVTVRFKEGGEAAQVRIDHPTLGRVELELALQGQRLTVQARPEGISAAQALRAAEAVLRTGIARSGFELGALRIHRPRPSAEPAAGTAAGDAATHTHHRRRGGRRRRRLDLEA